MNRRMLYVCLFVVIFSNVTSLKLLVVFPVPARSHNILGNTLSKGLASLGHEVTFVSPFADPNPPKNYKDIVLANFIQQRADHDKERNMFDMANISPLFQIVFLNNIGAMLTEGFFNSTEVKTLLNSKEKFDAVIAEQFLSDSLSVLGHHYQAPYIIFSTIGSNRWINNLVGNPEPASYIPDIFLSYSSTMTFWERSYNLLFSLVSQLNLYCIFYPQQRKLVEHYFPDAPDFDQLQYNVSLVLLNSHESINQPVPHVPNMIDIGGYHVNPPKSLPKDLQDFMDNAKYGVIYFSMGSNLKPSNMPKNMKDAVLKVLGSRKENVLWKWDEDVLENQPANVKISKWFPQQGILAHPNCKLFITHGGLLSTTETITMGVPILALPVFGDQKLNAARAESLGYGKSLSLTDVSESSLSAALEELLSTPKFRENAKLRSQLLKDRPVKPIELADYWIRYVVKYKGALHLRVGGVNLPFYQYWMLDVLAAYVGGFILSVYVLVKLYRYRKCKGKTSNASTTKKRQ